MSGRSAPGGGLFGGERTLRMTFRTAASQEAGVP